MEGWRIEMKLNEQAGLDGQQPLGPCLDFPETDEESFQKFYQVSG